VSETATPSDVPDPRRDALERLDVLVGAWEMEASFPEGAFGPGKPAFTSRGGRTTFEWLPGRAFLIQRFGSDVAEAPSGIAIIGAGDEAGTLCQHYFDSRGVKRVYRTSLEGRTWKLWREAPGFHQRFAGALSDDGTRIEGAWEKSADGHEWQHDFTLTYFKADA
jgi:hypothetical protein